MTLTRRFFLTGAAALVASPAIVKAENIMRVVAPRGVMLPALNGWQLPTGTIQYFMQPGGFLTPKLFTGSDWIIPAGQSLLRAHFPDLAKAISMSHGGEFDKFQVPDLREQLINPVMIHPHNHNKASK